MAFKSPFAIASPSADSAGKRGARTSPGGRNAFSNLRFPRAVSGAAKQPRLC